MLCCIVPQALTHARVPIVKFFDQRWIWRVTCASTTSSSPTRALKDYARIDPACVSWRSSSSTGPKQRKVNETYRGTLSSYAYVLYCTLVPMLCHRLAVVITLERESSMLLCSDNH